MSKSIARPTHSTNAVDAPPTSTTRLWLDFSDATDAERALIASLTPAELADVTAAAKEAAETKAAEIRARRAGAR